MDHYFKSETAFFIRKSDQPNKSLAFYTILKQFTRNEYLIWTSTKIEGLITISKEEFESAVAPYLEKLNDPSKDLERIMIKNNEELRPIYEQLYASLEERVEILASNPYRFYTSLKEWTLPYIGRIEIVDECLEIALAQERYELCARIAIVKDQLYKIY